MQKWEYCLITGVMVSSIGKFEGRYPRLYFFGLDGLSQEVNLGDSVASQRPKEFQKVSEGGYIAHWIAKLGSEGWEMVGTGKGDDQSGLGANSIYFRRPLE